MSTPQAPLREVTQVLPNGWGKVLRYRQSGKSAGSSDIYIFTPGLGLKLRSTKELCIALKNDPRLFDLINPDEVNFFRPNGKTRTCSKKMREEFAKFVETKGEYTPNFMRNRVKAKKCQICHKYTIRTNKKTLVCETCENEDDDTDNSSVELAEQRSLEKLSSELEMLLRKHCPKEKKKLMVKLKKCLKCNIMFRKTKKTNTSKCRECVIGEENPFELLKMTFDTYGSLPTRKEALDLLVKRTGIPQSDVERYFWDQIKKSNVEDDEIPDFDENELKIKEEKVESQPPTCHQPPEAENREDPMMMELADVVVKKEDQDSDVNGNKMTEEMPTQPKETTQEDEDEIPDF